MAPTISSHERLVLVVTNFPVYLERAGVCQAALDWVGDRSLEDVLKDADLGWDNPVQILDYEEVLFKMLAPLMSFDHLVLRQSVYHKMRKAIESVENERSAWLDNALNEHIRHNGPSQAFADQVVHKYKAAERALKNVRLYAVRELRLLWLEVFYPRLVEASLDAENW